MNELTLKKAKRIGRKWAYINTITGVIVAFLIFMTMTSYSTGIGTVVESVSYLSIVITSAFIFSYFIGGVAGIDIVNTNYSISKWILYYFLIVFFSVLICPFLMKIIFEPIFPIYAYIMLMLIATFVTLVVGSIPIIFFGFIYGRKLENEVMDLINKKEPKI
jgi:hypothetical protein